MARCQSSWQPPSPRVHASVMPVPGHDPGIDPAILDVGTADDAFSLSIAHPAVIRLHHPSPHPEERSVSKERASLVCTGSSFETQLRCSSG